MTPLGAPGQQVEVETGRVKRKENPARGGVEKVVAGGGKDGRRAGTGAKRGRPSKPAAKAAKKKGRLTARL